MKYDKERSKQVMKLGRYNIGRVTRMVTGHNALGYFQSKIDGEISPICRFCEEENETFWHWCTECPVFREARNDSFLDKDPSTGEWSVRELLDFGENNKIYEVFEGVGWKRFYNNEDSPTSSDDQEWDPG
jgi:hypothetical protein